MDTYELRKFPDAGSLARASAVDWIAAVNKSPAAQSTAFSGGRIATAFFTAAADLAGASGGALAKVDYFWADERCVPPDSPDSNFLLAQKNLFDVISIPADKIHRLKGELPQARAVAGANAEIGRIVAKNSAGIPMLDIIFLGLGENAHTASLMPNAPESVAGSQAAYVAIQDSPKPPPNRISLTYAAIAAAREVWMLASGSGKDEALRESLKPGSTTPFGRVLQSRPRTVIYTDISI